jgi:hypothetical protein
MPLGLPQSVRDNIEKCRAAAIAAVDVYNRPGPGFRTAHDLTLMGIVLSAIFLSVASAGAQTPARPQYQSAYMRIELALDQPAFAAISLDSLGKGKLILNPLRPPKPVESSYQLRQEGPRFEYRPAGAAASTPPVWTFAFSPRHVHLHSNFSVGGTPPPLVLNFDPYLNHATLLGIFNEDSSVRLPALLHLPDLGTLRITSPTPGARALGFDAQRLHGHGAPPENIANYIRITFPGATAELRSVDYDLEVVAIHPQVPGIEHDPRFDGFRRNWLNIFQMLSRNGMLANNSVSGACPCSVYMYSSVAERTPPLAPGLTALDLLRQTLDRYLGGYKGIGMEGYDNSTSPGFMDSYPSLLIAAGDYIRASKDHAWLERNYSGLKAWTTRMLAKDVDGDGLLEYPETGNSNSWPEQRLLRPANWWDTIGYGHKDAYANALAYHALVGMAEVARLANQPDDARMYAAHAEAIRSIYFKTFLNPSTGVLAGWKSADGNLHDYYFTYLNGMAITYGLVPPDKANLIMDRLLAEMKEVGFTHFENGLPGNLIPVRRGDYAVHEMYAGGGTREDGSDGFQIYENGGESGNFVYYTLKALYSLGRHQEADAILFPLLSGYEKGVFQGFGPNDLSYDWRTWDGTPWGYEGLLVDNYQALLAVLSR